MHKSFVSLSLQISWISCLLCRARLDGTLPYPWHWSSFASSAALTLIPCTHYLHPDGLPSPTQLKAQFQTAERPGEMTSTWPPGPTPTDLSKSGKRTRIGPKRSLKIRPLRTSNYQPHLTITYKGKGTCPSQPPREIVSWIFSPQSCFLRLPKSKCGKLPYSSELMRFKMAFHKPS